MNLFRIATWSVHWWEIAFPVLMVGMLLRFGAQHRQEAWYRAESARRSRIWAGRAALLAGYPLVYWMCSRAYPYALALDKNRSRWMRVAVWRSSISSSSPTFPSRSWWPR